MNDDRISHGLTNLEPLAKVLHRSILPPANRRSILREPHPRRDLVHVVPEIAREEPVVRTVPEGVRIREAGDAKDVARVGEGPVGGGARVP